MTSLFCLDIFYGELHHPPPPPPSLPTQPGQSNSHPVTCFSNPTHINRTLKLWESAVDMVMLSLLEWIYIYKSHRSILKALSAIMRARRETRQTMLCILWQDNHTSPEPNLHTVWLLLTPAQSLRLQSHLSWAKPTHCVTPAHPSPKSEALIAPLLSQTYTLCDSCSPQPKVWGFNRTSPEPNLHTVWLLLTPAQSLRL